MYVFLFLFFIFIFENAMYLVYLEESERDTNYNQSFKRKVWVKLLYISSVSMKVVGMLNLERQKSH